MDFEKYQVNTYSNGMHVSNFRTDDAQEVLSVYLVRAALLRNTSESAEVLKRVGLGYEAIHPVDIVNPACTQPDDLKIIWKRKQWDRPRT